MLFKYFVLGVALLVPVASENGIVLQNYEVTCHANTTIFKILECKSIKRDTGHFNTNVRAILNKNIGRDVDLHIKATATVWKTKKIMTLADLKLQLCLLLQYGIGNSMLNVFLSEVRRTSNFPFKCPLKGNFLYRIENYTASSKNLPLYIPEMNGTYSLTVYVKNQYAASYTSHGTYLSKKNLT